MAAARDAAWNREVRGESEAERADRNFRDLLQELRITLSGSQILFAFLLVVPFDAEFRRTSPFEHGVYFATLLTSALSAGLLVAPAAMHRVAFRQHVKDPLVKVAGFVALGGQTLFALALSEALLLIGAYLYGVTVGAAMAGAVLAWFMVWFFALPLALRGRERARR